MQIRGKETCKQVTKRDLIEYLAGVCDPEMRERIATEGRLTGSAVQRWLAELDSKLAAPFDVDWSKLRLTGNHDGQEVPAGETLN